MTAHKAFLTEEETMAVLNKSTECIKSEFEFESECSIDEVEELLTVLKDDDQELEGWSHPNDLEHNFSSPIQ